jgi:hypothetical protein
LKLLLHMKCGRTKELKLTTSWKQKQHQKIK